MTNTALESALKQIEDAFRPERKIYQEIVLQGMRVMTLVDDGRYSFTEACKLMTIDADKVAASHLWLIEDNARLNATYSTDTHCQTSGSYMMVGWFREQAEAKIVHFEAA